VIATATTRCCGLVLVAGLLLPAILRGAARVGQNVPSIPGFVIAWHKDQSSTGRLDLTATADLIIVSGPTTAVTARAREDGRVLWTLEHGATVAPVVVDDTVYIANQQTLAAYGASTGRARWSAQHRDLITTIGPAPDGVLVATTTPRDATGVATSAVRFLAATDGRQRWAHPIDRPLHVAPVTHGAHVFLSPATQSVAAWSLDSGVERWRILLEAEPSRLDVGGNRLYVAAVDEGFFVVVPESGWIDWRLARAKLIGSPAVEPDRVYLSLLDNTVACYDRRGALQWRHGLSGRPMTGPVAAEHTLILPLTSRTIVALDKVTGEPFPRPDAAADSPERHILAFGAGAGGDLLFVVTVGFGEQRTLTAFSRGPTALPLR
jgi:outer membrane protein assembly factor BamB